MHRVKDSVGTTTIGNLYVRKNIHLYLKNEDKERLVQKRVPKGYVGSQITVIIDF